MHHRPIASYLTHLSSRGPEATSGSGTTRSAGYDVGANGYVDEVTRILALLAVVCGLVLGIPIAAGASDGADEQRVVRVGTEGVYPPFTFRDPETNELTGFDIDVMRAVGEEAGWDVRFVEAPFDALFPALDSRRIDAI